MSRLGTTDEILFVKQFTRWRVRLWKLQLAAVFGSILIVACNEPMPPSDVSNVTDSARVCDAGTWTDAGCTVCVPHARVCSADGRSVRECSSDGMSWTEASTCDTEHGIACVSGQCVAACDVFADAGSAEGCGFHAVNTLNSSMGQNFAGSVREDFSFDVVLHSRWGVPVDVQVNAGGLPATRHVVIAPWSDAHVVLPWTRSLVEGSDALLATSAFVQQGAAQIRSSLPVSATQFNPFGFVAWAGCELPRCSAFSAEATRLMPDHALGTRYVAVAWPTSRSRARGETQWRQTQGFVSIVATQPDPTRVTVKLHGAIEPSSRVQPIATDGVWTGTLEANDVLQLVSRGSGACEMPEVDTVYGHVFCVPVDSEDLTGTRVESDRPVAVFAGHDCALVPYNRFTCDHLEEQLPPIEALGTRYLVARTLPYRNDPDIVRVVSIEDNTDVTTVSGTSTRVTNLMRAGTSTTFEIRALTEITSNHPVLVAQLLVGSRYDPIAMLDEGDPSMAVVVPPSLGQTGYRFVIPFDTPNASVTAITQRGTQLELDGVPLRLTPVESRTDLEVMQIPVSAGSHTLRSVQQAPFVGSIKATGRFTSFLTSLGYATGQGLPPQ